MPLFIVDVFVCATIMYMYRKCVREDAREHSVWRVCGTCVGVLRVGRLCTASARRLQAGCNGRARRTLRFHPDH